MRAITALHLALLVLLGSELWAQQGEYQAVPPREGERCIVCGMPLTEDDVALLVRGRRVPLKRSMVDSFLNHQDEFFSKLQPKGALFQENLEAPRGVAQGGIDVHWFAFGAYVLLGLVFGGLSAYAAVARGLPARRYFLLGFFFLFIGYGYAPSRPYQVPPESIPSGLVKVPDTHAPVLCPKCGAANHPSAERCTDCGNPLEPIYKSEVSRAK